MADARMPTAVPAGDQMVRERRAGTVTPHPGVATGIRGRGAHGGVYRARKRDGQAGHQRLRPGCAAVPVP